ncbi:MAG: HEPN domain-containing protein [Chloroflexi bacterium]|nr:HEPN domain-containing protein [Chloroflexota bacterium]
MDPLDYLGVARALAEGVHGEAELRTAVNRAYVGALLVLREALVAKGWLPARRSPRDPQEMVTMLRSRPGYRLVGDMLDELRLLRIHADYEHGRPLGLAEARRALALAEQVARRVPGSR